jgi:hypothetical protein
MAETVAIVTGEMKNSNVVIFFAGVLNRSVDKKLYRKQAQMACPIITTQ